MSNHKLGLMLQGDRVNLNGHKHEHNGHTWTELYGGGHYEHCTCGSTRKVNPDGRPSVGGTDDAQGWHTCTLCTPQLYRGR
jgi:hypothetical protein